MTAFWAGTYVQAPDAVQLACPDPAAVQLAAALAVQLAAVLPLAAENVHEPELPPAAAHCVAPLLEVASTDAQAAAADATHAADDCATGGV